MKKLATLLVAFFVAHFASAQYVIVNSPSAVAGAKDFSTGSMSVDLLSDIWTSDVVLADPVQGCADLANAAAVAGKIVLIDRGTCNFSTKVMNAKKAGAMAIVVFNNAAGAGTIVMGTTAIAGDTLPIIPAVMLSLEDGVAIKAELANGPVNMTIGNVKFDNDLHVDRELVANGPVGTIPAHQLSGFKFKPGVAVQNNGLNDAYKVDVNGVAKFTPAAGGAATTVFNQTASLPFLAVDSTELILLPDFTPGPTPGRYDFVYNVVSDSIDNVDADNAIGSEFTVTENVYCKGRWDAANKRPFQTNAYRPSTSTLVEFIAGFEFPKGKGYSIDSIQFYIARPAGSVLSTIPAGTLNAFVYEWNDDDLNGFLTAGEFNTISINEIDVTTLPSVVNAWVTVPVSHIDSTSGIGVPIPEDGKNYFIGIRYEGDSTIFIGFDEAYDYTASVELTPDPVAEIDLGYLGTTVWDGLAPSIDDLFTFTDNRAGLAVAAYVNPYQGVKTNDQFANNVSIKLLPNPVSTELVAEINLVESVQSIEYSILDASGRLVSRSVSDVNGISEKAVFNVSKLAAGQYFMKVKSEKGSKTTAFTVQH